VAIPPVATYHTVAGLAELPTRMRVRPAAVLFDRDGTLIVDVPYNGDPSQVQPMPGALCALERLRRAGMPIGVVTNQSAVARGAISLEDVNAVNRRVEELLGPLGEWVVCPHDDSDNCDCRKPEPGMVIAAARRLGVDRRRVAVVGDTAADIRAAAAAGARGILVPNAATRSAEVGDAPEVAPDLRAAVDLLLEVAA